MDDLATLSELDENSLMNELQARYNKDIIYVTNLSSYVSRQLQNILGCFSAKLVNFHFISWPNALALRIES